MTTPIVKWLWKQNYEFLENKNNKNLKTISKEINALQKNKIQS